jgi:serine/threonine-protein kinase
MPLAAGALVTPTLRLVRHLDGGGMGQVWIAEHLTLRAYVAVKFMASSITDAHGAAERFAREARAAAQIRSPHVVQVFDHGLTAEGAPYIVMELLDGEDLSRRLARLGVLDVRSTAILLRQIGRALEKAHSLGIVHRDIKPGNVFLVDAGGDLLAKLLDFGIAKQFERVERTVTESGVMVGSPAYMSPEQIVHPRGVDFRSDLWALAVVAYECLTGRKPFEGESVGALCMAIERGTFRPPTALRPDLPRALDAWFQRAFAREARSRFGSAREMGEAFVAAAGLPLQDAPAALEVGPAHEMQAALGSAPTLAGTAVSTKSRGPSRTALIALGAALSFGTLSVLTVLALPRLRMQAEAEAGSAPKPTTTAVEARAPAVALSGSVAPLPSSSTPVGPAAAPTTSATAAAATATVTASAAKSPAPVRPPPRRRNRGF